MVWVGRDLKDHPVPIPLPQEEGKQEHLPLDQSAQIPVQLSLNLPFLDQAGPQVVSDKEQTTEEEKITRVADAHHDYFSFQRSKSGHGLFLEFVYFSFIVTHAYALRISTTSHTKHHKERRVVCVTWVLCMWLYLCIHIHVVWQNRNTLENSY